MGKSRLMEGGAFPDIIFCMWMPLLYFSLACNGRIFSRSKSSCSRDDRFRKMYLSERL